jgi:hypothetical protein
MTEISSKENLRDKEFILGWMEENMMDYLKMKKCMGKVYLHGQMDFVMRESMKMI